MWLVLAASPCSYDLVQFIELATEARRWELRLGKLWPLLELEEQRQKFASQNTGLTRYSKQKGFWVAFLAGKGVDTKTAIVEYAGEIYGADSDLAALPLDDGAELNVFKIVSGG